MPPPPRAKEAWKAMKTLGFSCKETVLVLKKLIKVYDNNWEYIEDNHYQVLIDSIHEAQELKVTGGESKDVAIDDSDFQRKRQRNLSDDPLSLVVYPEVPGETSLKKLKIKNELSTAADLRERRDLIQMQANNRERVENGSARVTKKGRAEPISSQVKNKGEMYRLTLSQTSSAERIDHDLLPINCGETRASSCARKAIAGQANAEQPLHLAYNRDENQKIICPKKQKIEPYTEVCRNHKTISLAKPNDKEAELDLPKVEPTTMISPHYTIRARDKDVRKEQAPSIGRDLSSENANISDAASHMPLCELTSQFSSAITPPTSIDSDVPNDEQLAALGQSLLLSFQLGLEKERSLSSKEFAAKVNAVILSATSLGASLSSWLPKWQNIEKLLFKIDELRSLLQLKTSGDLERKKFEEVSSELSAHLVKVNEQQREVDDRHAQRVKMFNEHMECELKIHKLKNAIQRKTVKKMYIEALLSDGLVVLGKKEAALKALVDQQEGLERAKDQAKVALDEFLLDESKIKKDIENLEALIQKQWPLADPLDP